MWTNNARDSSILSPISPTNRDSCAYASISEKKFRVTDFSYSLNDTAQQRRGPSEQRTSKSLHAPAVCCSAWFGVRAVR